MSAALELDRYVSVPKLGAHIRRFEAAVVNGVVDLTLDHFREKGAEEQGRALVMADGTRWGLVAEFGAYSRRLSLYLLPAGQQRELVLDEIVIDHVGLVRNVQLHWPSSLARRNRKLPGKIEQFVRNRYIELKQAFVSRYTEAHQKLMVGFWPLLRSEFEKRGAEQYVELISPTVTHLDNMNFRYALDYESMAAVLEKFEHIQPPEFSPLELTLALVLEEVGHTANILNRNFAPGAVLGLPTSAFVSFETDRRVFAAEVAVLGAERFVDYNVCRVSNYLFQVGMPANVAEHVVPILDSARPLLQRRFEENLSAYLKFLKRFRVLPLEPGELEFRLGRFGAGIATGIIDWIRGAS